MAVWSSRVRRLAPSLRAVTKLQLCCSRIHQHRNHQGHPGRLCICSRLHGLTYDLSSGSCTAQSTTPPSSWRCVSHVVPVRHISSCTHCIPVPRRCSRGPSAYKQVYTRPCLAVLVPPLPKKRVPRTAFLGLCLYPDLARSLQRDWQEQDPGRCSVCRWTVKHNTVSVAGHISSVHVALTPARRWYQLMQRKSGCSLPWKRSRGGVAGDGDGNGRCSLLQRRTRFPFNHIRLRSSTIRLHISFFTSNRPPF